MKIGFDNDKYLKMQSEYIRERIGKFGDKLYLEFGGKLFDDFHASRVLPGFQPDSKLKMLLQLADQAEVIIVIGADAIDKNKKRDDLGITYDKDVLRLIEEYRSVGLYVGSVVVTKYAGQSSADAFKEKLEKKNIKVYKHNVIQGYPTNVAHIISDEGFGKNEYIDTSRPLVVVTAPGPGSGKMATCLSQLYHDHKRGVKAGYAKFETFPIWNLPLKHPVNLAYEAATADLQDVNMIDPYHLDAYGVTTVNYNRDVEVFPVLNEIFQRIDGKSPYKSPTDMGVNMAGFCIVDDEACSVASKQEIIRRYYKALCDSRRGRTDDSTADKINMIMKQIDITVDQRPVVEVALKKSEQSDCQPAIAIQLPDGRIVTGKTTNLLGACSAALLNAVKALGNIEKEKLLIQPEVIEPIQALKVNILGNHNPRLHSDEVLIALTISANTSPVAQLAKENLSLLSGCEAHSTVILAQIDEDIYRKLGINITCEPKYQTKKLYHK